MNPFLAENIAKSQKVALRSVEHTPYNDEEAKAVKAILSQIASFKLGRKLDKRDEREAWFDCDDQEALLDALRFSPDQRTFLGKMSLRLRVMTAKEEGKTARSLDLFAVEDVPGAEFQSSHHLLSVLVTQPEGSSDYYGLWVESLLDNPKPGDPEFDDIQAIVTSFLPAQDPTGV